MEQQQTELQLFEDAKIVTPLTEILEEIKPSATQNASTHSPSPSFKKSLDDLFPEQEYLEKNIKKAKEVLGDVANELTEIQLQSLTVEMQYLCESWLDNFEQEIFDGLTLKELLHEKGSK